MREWIGKRILGAVVSIMMVMGVAASAGAQTPRYDLLL